MHLYRPPPLSGVHFTVNAVCLGGVGIVAFRGKDQIMRKLGVAEKSPDTLYDVVIIKLQVFAADGEFLTMKWCEPRQILVNNAVKFLACPI
jgi:hypothetical protein